MYASVYLCVSLSECACACLCVSMRACVRARVRFAARPHSQTHSAHAHVRAHAGDSRTRARTRARACSALAPVRTLAYARTAQAHARERTGPQTHVCGRHCACAARAWRGTSLPRQRHTHARAIAAATRIGGPLPARTRTRTHAPSQLVSAKIRVGPYAVDDSADPSQPCGSGDTDPAHPARAAFGPDR
jgi:hypothetical protein